jgi:hypothetical protein
MSLETAIQQLKDAVTGEIKAREARVAAVAAEIARAKAAAAKIVEALPEMADLKAGATGYVLRVGRPHAITAELHVAETHSGHIGVAFRGSRLGKALPDEQWELLDPTAAAPDQGEPWDRILIKFCQRVDAIART